MKKVFFVSLLLVAVAVAALYLSPINYRLPGYHALLYPPAAYKSLLRDIHTNRVKMAAAYNRADSTRRDSVLDKTADLLMSDMQRVFKYWYGTPWSLNGTTETPGKGSIACGYFVTTVLRDTGFKIRRSRLAQLPSEVMIYELLQSRYIKRYVNTPLPDFISHIRKLGEGLYIVGLDTHTGFLVCQEGKVFFVHASGSKPHCVIKEAAEESQVLGKSSYRVVGKLTDDLQFIKKWYTL